MDYINMTLLASAQPSYDSDSVKNDSENSDKVVNAVDPKQWNDVLSALGDEIEMEEQL